MKNYLFRPFSDDDAKIENFNALKDYLPNKFKQPLIMFMGRLESYYDNIISELRSKCAVAVADERIIKGLEDKVRELKAENKELQADNDKLKNAIKVNEDAHFREVEECSNYHNSIKAENKELKAENVRLQDRNGRLVLEQTLLNDKDGLYDEVKELQAENVRLVEQVNYNRGNNSNGRTISGEIAEYISHNPKSKARMFLIPHNEFKNGECDNTIYWDDGIE